MRFGEITRQPPSTTPNRSASPSVARPSWRSGLPDPLPQAGEVGRSALGRVPAEVGVLGGVHDLGGDAVSDEDAIEELARGAEQRVHGDDQAAFGDRVPVEVALEAREIRLGQRRAAGELALRHVELVEPLGPGRDLRLDGVGQLAGSERPLAGVELDAVVLRRVVRRGEHHAERRPAVSDRIRQAGRRQVALRHHGGDPVMGDHCDRLAGELLRQKPGIVGDDDLTQGTALAEDREGRLENQTHVAEGEVLAYDAAPAGGSEVNHSRSSGGYHSCLAAGTLGLLLACCAPLPPPAAPAAAAVPGAPWQAERAAVVSRLNQARAQAHLPALAYDSLLERVGDAHSREVLDDKVQGHFALSGVPPYLRYLLAGGTGFHQENASSFSSSRPVVRAQLAAILMTSVERMLEEVAPHDGHRRTILDPWVTHVGVGLAWDGGEVRASQEFATLLAQELTPLPTSTTPRSAVMMTGRLRKPWQPAAVEVLWEELPHARTAAELRNVHAYSYPPRRVAFFVADRGANFGTGMPAASAALDKFGTFTFRWQTSGFEGVEVAIVLARNGSGRDLVPAAASATVVTTSGSLPPALERWRALGEKGGG